MKYLYRSYLKILWLLFVCFGITRAQNISFSSDSVLVIANGSESVISADFNQDNSPDLAIAIRNDITGHHVAVFLNKGTGMYNSSPDSIYPVGNFPRSISSGYFDNDSIIDLVTANNDSTITILFGNGDGSFGKKDSLNLPNNGQCINVADFDNDQNDDIAVAVSFSQLVIFKGNGDGTFSPPTAFPSGGTSYDMEVFDLNNDNYIDIIIGVGNTSSLSILFNDGSGNFSNRKSVYTVRPPWYVQICYLNSDGYPDIITGSGSYNFDNVFGLLGDDQGNYMISDTASPGSYVNHISANDFNNDNNTDVLVGDKNGIYILSGNGNGGFSEIDTIDYDLGNFWVTETLTKDLNNDRKIDLVVVRDDRVSVYYNTNVVNYLIEPEKIINSFKLFQNYPNPFNPTTSIAYQLPHSSKVTLTIYDLTGRVVQTLVNKIQTSGNHTVHFDAGQFPGGIYFYRLKVGNEFVEAKKMIYVR